MYNLLPFNAIPKTKFSHHAIWFKGKIYSTFALDNVL